EMCAEDIRVYRVNRPRISWNETILKSILAPKGLWEAVLRVENKKVRDLIENGLISESEIKEAGVTRDMWYTYAKRIPVMERARALHSAPSGGVKRLIITDLSRMKGGRVCIFGIDTDGNAIRPVIPYDGIKEDWLFDEAGKLVIKPFTEIEFDFICHLHKSPHTEDWEMNTTYMPRLIRSLSEEDRKKFLESILDGSVEEIFGTEVHEGRYTNPGEGNRSLGAIKVVKVMAVNYSMGEEGKYKYRIAFSDTSGEVYDLPITDCAFRGHCDRQRIQKGRNTDDIEAELQQILNQSEVFLRVGLTRPFAKMRNRCYLQVSGIYAFPDYRGADCENEINMGSAYHALQKYFGYTTFLPLQEDIIRDILLKNDVFVLMPTGGGKSLCYQLPALLLDGVAIVVSPLIALMKDQVDALKANGIAAAHINSSLSFDEMQHVRLDLAENMISILYVAPERIMIPDFLSALKRLNISLIAVDEAHCISEWGHDFRPGYRQLKLLKEHFPKAPLVALTATATSRVQEDITTQLRLSNPKIYKASFNRKNLLYQVKPKNDSYNQLLQYLEHHKRDSRIIYCYSRKSADDLANKLQKAGYRALPYHAGLHSDLRIETQDKFVKDDVEIIVATIAFGMGIDKSNVRFVIHNDLPKNLETYYQETGRAGRDGEGSDCIIFFSRADMRKIEYFIEQKEDETEKQIAYKKLHDMVDFCESRTCRRKILLEYFGETYDETNCGNCDNCLEPKETIDGTIIAQKIISCVSQVNEGFGINYIVDILRGSGNQKIIRNRHNTLTAYGTGREYSKKQWQAFTRELVQLGHLRSEGDRYPIVKLTQKSHGVLSGKEEVLLAKPEEEVQIIQQNVDEDFDCDLFEILRSLRKKLSDDMGMPPYIIFHDSSLKEMATCFPRSLSDFRKINGVGESKLEKYGELFLNEIINYCEKRGCIPSFPVKEETYSDKSEPYTVKEIQKIHPRAYGPLTKEDALLTKPTEEVQVAQRDVDGGFDRDLFEILRSLRKKIADAGDVAPDIIFHDSILMAMATNFPQDLSSFRNIDGIREIKLEKYGALFLKEIVDYCEKREHISPFPAKYETCSDKSKAYSVNEIQKTHPRAYEPWTEEENERLIADYKAGKTIEELMKLF
ncbi:MAG: DNA helicase RecQ, partial [Nitrospiraceae bacterium]|nr:DNA helicase RecQ [Nitrospiraceae bacterium]